MKDGNRKHLPVSVAVGKCLWFIVLQDIKLIMEEEQVGFPAGDVKKIVFLLLPFFAMLIQRSELDYKSSFAYISL